MIGDCWTIQKSEKGKRKKNVDANGRISLKQIQIYHFRPVWPLWPVGSVTCHAMERPIHISFCEKMAHFRSLRSLSRLSIRLDSNTSTN